MKKPIPVVTAAQLREGARFAQEQLDATPLNDLQARQYWRNRVIDRTNLADAAENREAQL